MNQIKIGRLIAEMRREQKMTQRQLADQAAALARLSSGADAVDSWWEGEVLHIELSAAAVDAVQLRDDIAFLLQIGQENIEVSINGGSE